MKSFSPHQKYVSALNYFSEGKKFMSSSWDGTIKIHDDSSNNDVGMQLFEFSHNIHGKEYCISDRFQEWERRFQVSL